MWKKILVCAVIIGSATASQRKRYVNSNGAGNGNYAPDFDFIDPYEFHQKLTQQILSQHGEQNRALTSTFASNDAAAFAEASNVADYDELFQEQFAHQRELFDNIRRQSQANAFGGSSGYSGGHGSGYSGGHGSGYSGGHGSGYSGSSGTGHRGGYGSSHSGTSSGHRGGSGSGSGSGSYHGNYAPNYASASGIYGPAGVHQTASIFPQNPSVPNIDTRFSEDSDNGGGGGGYHGVSVSSFSSSSDVNGKKTNQRGASTTVNNNGKVTTYEVHS